MIHKPVTHALLLRRPLGPVVMIVAALTLQACSNAAMYRAIQENRLQACEELPIAQQTGCKAQYQTDYESYKRIRDSQVTSRASQVLPRK